MTIEVALIISAWFCHAVAIGSPSINHKGYVETRMVAVLVTIIAILMWLINCPTP